MCIYNYRSINIVLFLEVVLFGIEEFLEFRDLDKFLFRFLLGRFFVS